jgi:hypothetical protein
MKLIVHKIAGPYPYVSECGRTSGQEGVFTWRGVNCKSCLRCRRAPAKAGRAAK